MLRDLDLLPSKNTWAMRVRDLLNIMGFSSSQGVGNEIAFLSLLQQRLKDIFIQGWCSQLDLSSTASLYRYIANIFSYKSYLDNISAKKI